MPIEATYTDGDYAVAAASTPLVLQRPFEAIPELLVGTQRFFQNKSNFAAKARNTPHPDNADFLLVDETNFQDIGGGVQEWDRIYAKVPPSYDEPAGNFRYPFIGFNGDFGVNVADVTGRPRKDWNVPLQALYDFFVVGEIPSAPPVPATYEAWQDIPKILATRYTDSLFPNADVDYVDDGPPDGVNDRPTVPTRTEYEALIEADKPENADTFSIVVEDSKIERWMGNIYRRTTMRVKAI